MQLVNSLVAAAAAYGSKHRQAITAEFPVSAAKDATADAAVDADAEAEAIGTADCAAVDLRCGVYDGLAYMVSGADADVDMGRATAAQ